MKPILMIKESQTYNQINEKDFTGNQPESW